MEKRRFIIIFNKIAITKTCMFDEIKKQNYHQQKLQENKSTSRRKGKMWYKYAKK